MKPQTNFIGGNHCVKDHWCSFILLKTEMWRNNGAAIYKLSHYMDSQKHRPGKVQLLHMSSTVHTRQKQPDEQETMNVSFMHAHSLACTILTASGGSHLRPRRLRCSSFIRKSVGEKVEAAQSSQITQQALCSSNAHLFHLHHEKENCLALISL